MEQSSINDLDILITKYLENKCTEEEKKQLSDLLGSSLNERSTKEELYSLLDKFQDDQDNNSVDFERIYKELVSEITLSEEKDRGEQLLQKRVRIRRLVLQVLSAAAVICIGFLLGTIFSPHRNVITEAQQPDQSYVEIKAPLGARSEIMLNDGTEVLLNAGSSLRYRSDYNVFNRDLELEGEAYFKVAKNVTLPLVVRAGNINIKATGTEFNVKAYSEEGIIETTLVNGEVEISQNGNNDREHILVLKPSQKAIYAQKSDKLTLEKIKEIEPQAIKTANIKTSDLLVSPKTDVDQATARTKNKLIIRSENLESLCTKLQRKYNVTFLFGDELIKKHRFSGVLLDETLQQVLDVIKLTAPVDYFLDRKTVILYSNKEQAEKYSKNPNSNN